MRLTTIPFDKMLLAMRDRLLKALTISTILIVSIIVLFFVHSAKTVSIGYQTPHTERLMHDILQDEWPERLPAWTKLEAFEQGGFQDRFIEAAFFVSPDDGTKLLSDLNKTFSEQHDHWFLADSEKKRFVQMTPDGVDTTFVLPGNGEASEGALYVREVTIRQFTDTKADWHVQFSGSQF